MARPLGRNRKFMKPIGLPEPPVPTYAVPDIFKAGADSIFRRAIIIGNGSPAAENQSIGLVRALGLSDKHVLYVSLVNSHPCADIIRKLVGIEWDWKFSSYYWIISNNLFTHCTMSTVFWFISMFSVERNLIILPTWILMCAKCCVQRVTRPKGGINEWLHWLPVSIHKKLDWVFRQLFGYTPLWLTARGKKSVMIHSENGGGLGLSTILEADVKKIVTTAKETYEKYEQCILSCLKSAIFCAAFYFK